LEVLECDFVIAWRRREPAYGTIDTTTGRSACPVSNQRRNWESNMNIATGAPGADHRVSDLMLVARQTIAQVGNCWLFTVALDGRSSTRVVTPLAASIPGNDWSACIVTSLGSQKIAEIRQDDRVTLAFQNDPESEYVAPVGRATVIDDPQRIAARCCMTPPTSPVAVKSAMGWLGWEWP
jgi:hypothetical protein